MPRSVSRELRQVEKRLRATADAMLAPRDAARPIGTYTESRFQRAWGCLQEAADCMSYALGNVETYMPPEQRDPLMRAILDAMATEQPK